MQRVAATAAVAQHAGRAMMVAGGSPAPCGAALLPRQPPRPLPWAHGTLTAVAGLVCGRGSSSCGTTPGTAAAPGRAGSSGHVRGTGLATVLGTLFSLRTHLPGSMGCQPRRFRSEKFATSLETGAAATSSLETGAATSRQDPNEDRAESVAALILNRSAQRADGVGSLHVAVQNCTSFSALLSLLDGQIKHLGAATTGQAISKTAFLRAKSRHNVHRGQRRGQGPSRSKGPTRSDEGVTNLRGSPVFHELLDHMAAVGDGMDVQVRRTVLPLHRPHVCVRALAAYAFVLLFCSVCVRGGSIRSACSCSTPALTLPPPPPPPPLRV